MNGVICLDEIDKVGSGDKSPMGSLFKILDEEYNKDFSDNYLGFNFDLSKVLFVLCANDISKIPLPIIDRCEVIYVNGYCAMEKFEIAKNMIKKKFIELKVEDGEIEFESTAITHLIIKYTYESGVRKLSQLLTSIIKKTIIDIETAKNLEGDNFKKKTVIIDKEDVDRKLSMFTSNSLSKIKNGIGMATGLAYNGHGGSLLSIECTSFKSLDGDKYKFVTTGNLKTVITESISIATSWIKSNSHKYKDVDLNFFQTYNVNVHIPEGGTPKDGPSAGVTFCTALMSLVANKPVKEYVAMTGELSLTGNILPVGGITEKINSVDREIRFEINQLNSIKRYKIFLPSDNESDLRHIDKSVFEFIDIKLVSHISEVLAEAIDWDFVQSWLLCFKY